WNLAVMPEDSREQSLNDMQPTLNMDDEEFQEFKHDVVMPMIRRHEDMFPQMQQRRAPDRPHFLGEQAMLPNAQRRPAKKYAGTGRNERCPCGSGKKYKVCCGR
ncbi:MAG: SEC-C metal-binding domain-containing protein, partial [Thiohalocapsa sp.]